MSDKYYEFNLEAALAGHEVVTREGVHVAGIFNTEDDTWFPIESKSHPKLSWSIAGEEYTSTPRKDDLFMLNPPPYIK